MSEWRTTEVVPGIVRIESVLGPRPFSQYLVRGERTLLVDTGTRETPAATILPALESLGVSPTELDFVAHEPRGRRPLRRERRAAGRRPAGALLAHTLGLAWIESSERILRERYGWYGAHGVGYDPETAAWLRDAMGPTCPSTSASRAASASASAPSSPSSVLHLPGHSPGHIGLWERRTRTAIVMDAVMANGLLDLDGAVIHPPPYFDVAAYVGVRPPAGEPRARTAS